MNNAAPKIILAIIVIIKYTVVFKYSLDKCNCDNLKNMPFNHMSKNMIITKIKVNINFLWL